jgi:hypothetical protein
VLEGAAHVGFNVTLSGAGRRHRSRGRLAAWSDQYDARRFAKPLAKSDAAPGGSAIHCNHCDNGHGLGNEPLARWKLPPDCHPIFFNSHIPTTAYVDRNEWPKFGCDAILTHKSADMPSGNFCPQIDVQHDSTINIASAPIANTRQIIMLPCFPNSHVADFSLNFVINVSFCVWLPTPRECSKGHQAKLIV